MGFESRILHEFVFTNMTINIKYYNNSGNLSWNYAIKLSM